MSFEFARIELVPMVAAGDKQAIFDFCRANQDNIFDYVGHFSSASLYPLVDHEDCANYALYQLINYLQENQRTASNFQDEDLKRMYFRMFNQRFNAEMKKLYGKKGSLNRQARAGHHTNIEADVPFTELKLIDLLEDGKAEDPSDPMTQAEIDASGIGTERRRTNDIDYIRELFVTTITSLFTVGTRYRTIAELYFLQGKSDEEIRAELKMNTRPTGHIAQIRDSMRKRYAEGTEERRIIEFLLDNHKKEAGANFRALVLRTGQSGTSERA